MRPEAPSLDVIAAQGSQVAPAAQDQNEESRSSSSTNSPAPVEGEESDFFLANNDSSSSLGVPNIQDMQVNDEEDDSCRAPIYQLPNEVLINIFSKLTASSVDLLNCMLTCKRFAKNTVDLLWHRPACTNWNRQTQICRTLSNDSPYFAYRDFVRRLNLASLAGDVNDGSVEPFANCSRIERLTLTNCRKLTDAGLIKLVANNPNLLALDISNDVEITEQSIYALAENCRRIQGLNVSNCRNISNESMVKLAENCRSLKRLKLNDCDQMRDATILAFANRCRHILEIDLQKCGRIGNEPITALMSQGRALRELRLANCDLIDDGAFLGLAPGRIYEHLRILDLTSCNLLTDRAVEKIIEVAPRLRNLVLAKCRNVTDAGVNAIAKLGRNLHYVHLGHCSLITDEAVKRLIANCTRIRYIDLGCCLNLTDDSITRLATLPKLKRIGLVKCQNITDESVFALARMGQRRRVWRDPITGHPQEGIEIHTSSLERVHLSYCTNLTLKSVYRLLNASPRLTHLSVTGVLPFIREDLAQFCRDAPADFNDHQRNVFCVFSGPGVTGLRDHLNRDPAFEPLRVSSGVNGSRSQRPGVMQPTILPTHNLPSPVDEDQEPDVAEDDDEDGPDIAQNVGGGVPGNPVNPPPGGNWPGVVQAPPPPPAQPPS